MASWLAETYMG